MAHILIIDDEDLVRRSVCKFLEHEGHTVSESSTGKEGLDLVHRQSFDLLITDIFMPEIDGLEVIQKLRQENSSLKILAITGGGTTGGFNFLPQAKAFGAHATLRKPFLHEELLEALQVALNA